jgi:hypothetical protein
VRCRRGRRIWCAFLATGCGRGWPHRLVWDAAGGPIATVQDACRALNRPGCADRVLGMARHRVSTRAIRGRSRPTRTALIVMHRRAGRVNAVCRSTQPVRALIRACDYLSSHRRSQPRRTCAAGSRP